MSEFSVTAQGMRSTLPVITLRPPPNENVNQGNDDDDDCLTIAILGCRHTATKAVMGFLLYPLSWRHGERGPYEINVYALANWSSRLVSISLADLGGKTRFQSMPESRRPRAYMTWATIDVMHRPLSHMDNRFDSSLPSKFGWRDQASFLFSRWSIEQLLQYGFHPDSNARCPQDGDLPTELDKKSSVTFLSTTRNESFTIYLEKCICSDNWLCADVTFNADTARPVFQATDPLISDYHSGAPTTQNSCSRSRFHVGKLQNTSMMFGNEDRKVELTFELHLLPNATKRIRQGMGMLTADHISLVDIKLSGKVYVSLCEELREQGANVLNTASKEEHAHDDYRSKLYV